MVSNFTNINKTNNERLNSNGQQFLQYQQNKQRLNRDGQQFYQYKKKQRKA